MTPEQIRETIERGLPGARAEVRDLTGTGDHYQAVVGCEVFVGKSLIQQHQLVYGVLGSAVGAEIHALMLKTCLPDDFDAARQAAADS